MQIVIEICEEDYAETLYRKQHLPREMDWADRVIANGIPLPKVFEDIKAEIKRHCNITVGSDNEPAMTLHDIFGVLDKHISGKENNANSN